MPSIQRQAVPALVNEICTADPLCGIVLQGSVAKRRERPESDIDFTVVLNDRDVNSIRYNRLINPANHGGMIRVRDEVLGLNIDINWRFASSLAADIEQHGAREWFIFTYGEVLHDPKGLARHCQQAGRKYFDAHPRVFQAWTEHSEIYYQHKLDPGMPIKYPRWGDFAAYLKTIEDK
jgi:hypothetical protein